MRTAHRTVLAGAGLVAAILAAGVLPASADDHGSSEHDSSAVVRAALEPGKVKNIVVIDLENEDFGFSFGPSSPARYLNDVLVPQGQLLENYYATSHASMGNYVSQISGEASTQAQNNDCIDLSTLRPPFNNIKGSYTDVTPATPVADGQVIGDGCVLPASVLTIADQLDAKYAKRSDEGDDGGRSRYPWRAYVEDMGNIPSRDYGNPDPTGGTTCAHPPIGGADNSNSAVAGDSYATRHNPFMYFHSITDDQAKCDERVVPLGTLTVGTGGATDSFSGHLATDLRSKRTTPAFSFIVPDLCNDGHDAACKPASTTGSATDVEGGTAGGLAAADLWLKHWIPLLMASPSYRSGEMLIVVTFDEAGISQAGSAACCDQPSGPNQNGNPGYAGILKLFGTPLPTGPGQYPGGGKVGAVLLNRKYIVAGSHNTTGSYNHYSALRSYEDLLGITTGGADGLGHLGYAGTPGLQPFGTDVFGRRHD
jgi:hypothetical protein